MALRLAALGLVLCLSCGSSPGGIGAQPRGPALVSPSDGAAVAGPSVDFAWDAWTGATKYYHQISADSSMTGAIETIVTGTGLTMEPSSTGVWWWRVRASVTGISGYTPWSQVWRFTLE
jgi:hypothetical protein